MQDLLPGVLTGLLFVNLVFKKPTMLVPILFL